MCVSLQYMIMCFIILYSSIDISASAIRARSRHVKPFATVEEYAIDRNCVAATQCTLISNKRTISMPKCENTGTIMFGRVTAGSRVFWTRNPDIPTSTTISDIRHFQDTSLCDTKPFEDWDTWASSFIGNNDILWVYINCTNAKYANNNLRCTVS